MKVTGPGVFSLEGLGQWARTIAASIAQGWQVEHNVDGTHLFPWFTPLFLAANYDGASTMSWTVTSAGFRQWQYRRVGSTMDLAFDIEGTVAGTPNGQLQMLIPGGYQAVRGMRAGTFAYNDAGTTGTGHAEVSGDKIQLYKSLTAPNWTAGTVRAAGALRFEVQ